MNHWNFLYKNVKFNPAYIDINNTTALAPVVAVVANASPATEVGGFEHVAVGGASGVHAVAATAATTVARTWIIMK